MVAPERAGQVAADHHLQRQRLELAHHQHRGIRHVEDVIGSHVLRLVEPEHSEPVEQLAFEGDGGQHAIERRQPVGGDHRDAVTGAEIVAHLPPIEGAQRGKVGFPEGVRQLGAKQAESVHGGA